MQQKLFTIGVYGAKESDFFNALVEHKIDTFCDIRLRRGMRGSKYAFVNSNYLQAKLASLGIQYFHFKDLAPSKATRDKQTTDDNKKNVKKRERQTLSSAFIQAYQTENLSDFDSVDFLNRLGDNTERIVLFCVEKDPDACHRSLLSKRLVMDLNIELEHIIPCKS